MLKIVKNKHTYLVLSVLLLVCALLCCVSNSSSNVYASSEIDFSKYEFTEIPSGFDVANEGIVYKIHCPSVRGKVDDYSVEDYVTTISFKASCGYQIYFVNGVACNMEDASYGDYSSSILSDYYEVLQYDEINKYVYFKFKNIEGIREMNYGYLSDVAIWNDHDDYVESPKYLYLSQINNRPTDITENEAFFSSKVDGGQGAFYPTGYNIYSLEFHLMIDQTVMELFNKVDVSFEKGGELYTLYKSSFHTSDAYAENGFYDFEIITLSNPSAVSDVVQLKAVISYGDNKTLTVMSKQESLINLWQDYVSNGFPGPYLTDKNKEIMRKTVASYSSGFLNDIKGCQGTFEKYSGHSDLALESQIFRFPIANFGSASFSWSSSYWQGYTYHIYLSINSNFEVTTSAYKIETSETGEILFSAGNGGSMPTATTYVAKNSNFTASTYAQLVNDDNVAKQLYDSTDFIGYKGYYYVRFNNPNITNGYFPARASKSFSATARNSNYESVLEINTATVNYDEYVILLLGEIEDLNEQIETLTDQLQAKNISTEELRQQLSVIQTQFEGLKLERDNAIDELEYLREQVEVIRNEYKNKLEEIANNPDIELPSITDENETETEATENEMTFGSTQIVAIIMAVILLIALILLVIPKGRRKNK